MFEEAGRVLFEALFDSPMVLYFTLFFDILSAGACGENRDFQIRDALVPT